MPELLSAQEIDQHLSKHPNWGMDQGKTITRSFTFQDFEEAMRFVNAVAEEAEKMDHHPDMDIRWNKVKLSISTHSKGGLTENDFVLAERCEEVAGKI